MYIYIWEIISGSDFLHMIQQTIPSFGQKKWSANGGMIHPHLVATNGLPDANLIRSAGASGVLRKRDP